VIEVNSYLRAEDGQYTLVEDVADAPADPRYIEGALELTINGVPILDIEMWDYIDQLWSYVSDMVSGIREESEVSTYFPDQPIKLSFSKQGTSRVLVSVSINGRLRIASIEMDELFAELRRSGDSFFGKMMTLVPENADSYKEALHRLKSS
jgi:hypothetical protein